MNFTGFALKNYRSIGEEWVEVNPLKKINILIGKNNSGKSNLISGLEFISRFEYKNNKISVETTITDFHRKTPDNILGCKVYLNGLKEEELYMTFKEDVYFKYDWQKDVGQLKITEYFLSALEPHQIRRFYNGYHRSDIGPISMQKKDEFVESKSTQFHEILRDNHFNVKIIPEFRKMVSSGDELGYDGANLVETLGRWKSPRAGHDQDKKKFLKIQQILRDLTHIPTLEMDIAQNGGPPELIIEDRENELRLPIENYGTGLHELVILSTLVTNLNDHIICIEEPEIHLHPGLQKEFINFIEKDDSDNIYIISTHSNAFIDLVQDPMIFHVRLVRGSTIVNTVENTSDALHAIHDLGVRASDILQTNGVIWVEGPSDRIYINKWIELSDPDLEEGRDYSIMFYGGNLLSHTSIGNNSDSDELEEFVKLLRINQNSYLVMDSDRKKKDDSINATKQRLIDECERNNVGYWLTEYREIENYMPTNMIKNAVDKRLSREATLKFPKYSKLELIKCKREQGKNRDIDYSAKKPHYARLFRRYFTNQMFSDDSLLKNEIDKLVSTIKQWNDIPE